MAMHKTREILHESPRDVPRICGAGAYAAPQGKDFPLHQHPTWEVVCYRTGSIVCPIGGERYEARQGTILLTPPQTPHAEYARTGYSNYYFTVDAPPDKDWPRICFDDADGEIAHLCRTIVREWQSHSPDRDAMLALLAAQIDLLIQRSASATRMSEEELLVMRVVARLQQSLAAPVALQEIAREIGASPSAIRAAFSQVKKCSPSRYRQGLRLQHALAMLQGSSLTLETIASLCGYYSASHLSRHIKSQAGASPGQIRAATRHLPTIQHVNEPTLP